MIARRHLFAIVASAGLLASCAPPPATPAFPDLRFTGEQPLALQAGQIEIRDQSGPPGDPSYPVAPVQAMQNWARDRLRANGQGGPARFTINAAVATVKNIPSTQTGVAGSFTDQVSQEYDVAVDGTLEILDNHAMAIRAVHASAARSRTVLQSATPNDRDQARYDLVKALMADFDAQMEQQIRNNFGTYLLSR
jgi:hypothetical protein